MSEHDGRELTGSEASAAMAKASPRVSAIALAQRSLLQAAQACLTTNGGPIDAEDTCDGEAYVMVRRSDFDALDAAVKDLGKARAL